MVLLELLPLDEERRNRHLVYVAYFVRFLTDPALAEAVRDTPHALEELVAGLLAQGQATGLVPPDVATGPEGAFLVAAAGGLQAGMLLGQYTAEQVVSLIDHQLGRLFG
ncbi:hypothetical protein GCM10009677_01770 [Sphaerisporangium rubeum]